MRVLASVFFIVFIIFSCDSDGNRNAEKKVASPTSKNRTTVFTQVTAQKSNISFANRIEENVATMENLFNFDYFYNGAGVAVIDVNNDGLKDLFFTGNQVANALYLNKGNLVFQDVSDAYGVNQGKFWANGVTVADVNQDGWMDIYISQGGPRNPSQRANVLLMNEGGVRFRESAKKLNIADTGISTQSIFFDYDKDGDLDLVVSNESELYGLDPKRFMSAMRDPNNLSKSTINLYQNNGDTYIKVTKEAGLERPAFGLGPIVSDINNDGWLDIYIANDYYIPDALYINDQDGTFSDQIKTMTNQVSFYGMGVDIADVNNDALQDIFVLDMAASDHVRSKTLMASMNEDRFKMLTDDLGFAHQYMFNSLQLNQGNGKFHNVIQQAHMAKTDWSWAGLIADLDNDADRDVYVTNGYRRYALDNDLQGQVRETQRAFNGNVPLEMKQKLYDAMPTEKLNNILFQNDGNLDFHDESLRWGLAIPSYSNGAVYADLDNDGDLELVINNIDDPAMLYKNMTVENGKGNSVRVQLKGALSESFAKVSLYNNKTVQVFEAKRTKGYLSATEAEIHFGIGEDKKIDSIKVQWLSGRSEVRKNVDVGTLVFDESKATRSEVPVFQSSKNNKLPDWSTVDDFGISFQHKENDYNDFTTEVLLPYKQSTQGPALAKGDMNGDGLEDVFVGGAAGQSSALFIQTAGGFKRSKQPALENTAWGEDTGAIMVDVDGDSDLDLMVVRGDNAFAKADPKNRNSLFLNTNGVLKEAPFDESSSVSKSVVATDYDNDGDPDIIIGNRIESRHFPVHEASRIYNNMDGVFTDVTETVAPGLLDFGIINKIIATDIDGDGDEDLMAVGEWSGIGVFENIDGKFENVSQEKGLDTEQGWWFTIAETDVNKDGVPDFIVGNIGDNVKYKASKTSPFKVFASDFDANGTFDLVLSNEYNGTYVPARGKECSTQQMPFISDKFETYSSFANASLEDIYGNKLDEAYIKSVTTFSSKVIINDGKGNFEIKDLPALAQSAPILDISFLDINDDGMEDAFVAGAIYEAEVETPRYDTGTGLFLISDGEGNYQAYNPAELGLYIKGNVKQLLTLNHTAKKATLVLAGTSNESVEVFSLKN